MPGKILGLDFGEDALTAVQIRSGLKGHEVIACGRVSLLQGEGPDPALKRLREQMDLRSDTYLTSIPGDEVSYRNLAMPFNEPKKIRQTLPFEMETMVPFPIEDLLVDFTISDRSDHSDILAVSVRSALISDYLRDLGPHGIDPEVLEIRCVPMVSWLLRQPETPANGLLLDMGLKKRTMVLFLKGRIALIRTFTADDGPIGEADLKGSDGELSADPERIESSLEGFCTAVQNTIHAFSWLKKTALRPEKVFFTGFWALYPETGSLLGRFLNMPAEQVNVRRDRRVRMAESIAKVWRPPLMDHALAIALREDKRGQGFNFRRDEFEVKRHYLGPIKEIRKAALMLAVVLCFIALDLGVDYYGLKKRYTVLDQNIAEVFRKTFPEIKRVVDPVQQMKVKINEAQKSSFMAPGLESDQRVIDLLREISQRVPKSMDVHVTRMAVDPETMQVSGDTDTFNTVDSLKGRLEPSPYFSAVTISSANLDRSGKRVQFDLKLQRAK
ncbi:MAG: PilN domain-containing protein [Pseudomonadota bacterium]